MKKILLFFALFLILPVFGYENGADKGYTVIKTNHNYTPVREGANVNAGRFSHLKKGVQIFSDKDIEGFYRVDLGLGKYYWIEKKYVDVEKVLPERELAEVSSINFLDDEKYYTVEIEINKSVPYNEIETSEKTLDFIIYDTCINEEDLVIEGDDDGIFEISKDEFGNLKISYKSDFLLSGHEIINKDGTLLLKVKKPFKMGSKRHPLKNLTVVIDPGHGGGDFGACAFNLKEKDINLEISKLLKKSFEKSGANVYLTRKTDVDIDLYERVDFAKEKGADFLFSIHQNSLANPKNVDKKHGVGVYYYNLETYKLAGEIQKELVKKTEFKDDGVNFASFALTRAQNPLCVLIECGYIIHKDEVQKLSDPKFQKVVSKAISTGVKNYLKNNF